MAPSYAEALPSQSASVGRGGLVRRRARTRAMHIVVFSRILMRCPPLRRFSHHAPPLSPVVNDRRPCALENTIWWCPLIDLAERSFSSGTAIARRSGACPYPGPTAVHPSVRWRRIVSDPVRTLASIDARSETASRSDQGRHGQQGELRCCETSGSSITRTGRAAACSTR
jgi:hypothetical protein